MLPSLEFHETTVAATLSDAVGRRALVPASAWPTYRCSEHEGAGWEVAITQVDRRLQAALIRFVHARDDAGRRYPSEWLSIAALRPL